MSIIDRDRTFSWEMFYGLIVILCVALALKDIFSLNVETCPLCFISISVLVLLGLYLRLLNTNRITSFPLTKT